MKTGNCEVCGTFFKQPDKYEKKTCSKKCTYELVAQKTKARANGKLKKECEVCGSGFETWPSEDYRTCSRKCAKIIQANSLRGVPKTAKHRKNLSKSLRESKKAKKYQFKKGKDNPAYGRNQTGPANYNWKGGITNSNQKRRNDPRLSEWRTKVFQRDNYTCQDCGTKGYLHAHHIIPFSKDFSKAFDLNNGKTLCVKCHEKVHGRFIGKFKQS